MDPGSDGDLCLSDERERERERERDVTTSNESNY